MTEAPVLQLVGTQAIPGQTYRKGQRTLPVLPSDHFGARAVVCVLRLACACPADVGAHAAGLHVRLEPSDV